MNSKKLPPSSDKGQVPPLVTTGKRTRKAPSDASGTSESFMGPAEKKTRTDHPPITDRTVASHDIDFPDTCPVQTLASVLDDNSRYQDTPLASLIKEWEKAESIECSFEKSEKQILTSFKSPGGKNVGITDNTIDLDTPLIKTYINFAKKGVSLFDKRLIYQGREINPRTAIVEQLGDVIAPVPPGITCFHVVEGAPQFSADTVTPEIDDFLNSTFTDKQGVKQKVMPESFRSTKEIEQLLRELWDGISQQHDSPQEIKNYLRLERVILGCQSKLNSLPAENLSSKAQLDFLNRRKKVDTYLDCILRIVGVCKWLFISRQNQAVTQELDKLPEQSLPELLTDSAGTEVIIKTPKQKVKVYFSILERLGSSYFTTGQEFTSLQIKSSPAPQKKSSLATFNLEEFVREGPVLEALLQFLTKYNLEKVEELNAEEVIELYGIANCLQIDYLQTYCLRILLKAIRYNLFTTDQLKTLHDYKDSHPALERACRNSIDLAKLDAKLVLPPPQQLFPEWESSSSSTGSTGIFQRNCSIQ